jgi:uncharacterized protein
VLRRDFLSGFAATLFAPRLSSGEGARIAAAARAQIGVTTSYNPAYVRLACPNGDVPRSTGICADVVIRACRDALGLDLQKLVHEDMLRAFSAYPARRAWGETTPDASIDHRRVLNLEAFWTRTHAARWTASDRAIAGDAFPEPLAVGDFVTWKIDARFPHVAVVASHGNAGSTVIHNIGRGAEEIDLQDFHPHPASGHYRWPVV